MKKVYKKPIAILESFSLATSIAGDCEVDTNVQSQNVCGMDFSGLMVFASGVSGCTDIQVDSYGGDGDNNTICYHVPYGDNLFNS